MSNSMSLIHSRKHTRLLLAGMTCLVASLAFPAANASLIAADNLRWGVGSITVDTDTGLGWLDVHLTVNLSYNEMQSQLGANGQYDGFRYASQAEVETLFINAVIPDINRASTANLAHASKLLSLLGATSSLRGTSEIFGITGTLLNQAVSSAMLDHYFSDGTGMLDANVMGPTYGMDYRSSLVGSWLVTADYAEVPLPSALLLFSSALTLCSFIKRGPLRKSSRKSCN